jgi:Phage integrase, N-terminal SAM-like domain
VGDYYVEWIARKTPPVVRAGLARDYKEHFQRYILPKFKSVALMDVTPRRLEEFRAYLLNARGSALKSCRKRHRCYF